MRITITIRPVSLADLDRLYEIEVESFGRQLHYPKNLLKHLIDYYKRFFYVAEFNGEVIGYIVARVEGFKVHIVSLAVDPKHRGRGIGGKLMDVVLEEALNLKAETVELEVSTRNNVAVNLYLRKGFKIIEELEDYYGVGENAYRMSLSLRW